MHICCAEADTRGKHVLPFIPQVNHSAIEQVLREWKFTDAEIEKLFIVFEFRDMIPPAGVTCELAGGYCFVIGLRKDVFDSQEEVNRCVVHELRHIWYMLKVRRGTREAVRWEELNCKRMEEKYKKINFLTVPGF